MEGTKRNQNNPENKASDLSRKDFLKLIAALAAGTAGAFLFSNLPDTRKFDVWENDLPEPILGAKRFLLIGDVHAGDTNDSVRQTNTRSAENLQNVIDHLGNYPFDLLIQMGDVIKEGKNEARNIENYETVIDILKQFPHQTINLLGNHDLWGISPENISAIYGRNNLNSPYGVQQFDDFQIVWLDVIAEKNIHGLPPEERIDWLKSIIFRDTPTFIFSHYALLPQDISESYYFGGDSAQTAFGNGEKVWRALEGLQVHGFINAHIHEGKYSKVNNTHMITIPAFVENTFANTNENSGAYSIMEITSPYEWSLKSYLGNTCLMDITI